MFFFHMVFCVFVCISGWHTYKTPINPLTIFVGINGLVITNFSYAATIFFSNKQFSFDHIYFDYVLAVSLVFITAFYIGILISKTKLKLYNITNELDPKTLKSPYILFFFLSSLSIIFFLFLIYSVENGEIWIKDPRSAYLHYRKGVGHYYTLLTWGIMGLLVTILFFYRPKTLNLIVITFIFLGLSHFTGKKSLALEILFCSVIYYNFYIKSFSFFQIIYVNLFIIGSVFYLIISNVKFNIYMGIQYFDYADMTAKFLANFENIGLQYGYGILSSLWVLVPRSIFPSKPYEYGISIIHQRLSPGLAEKGHTAGIIDWSLYFLDFHILGVIIFGIISGFIKGWLFNKYIKNKNNFFWFMMLIHFSLFNLWAYLPWFACLTWMSLLYFLSRVRWN